MSITMTSNSARTKRAIRHVADALSPAKQDRVVRKVAYVVHSRAVRQTPKRWTGQTRKAWQVRKMRQAHWEVRNDTKAIHWLDQGTRAHGPVRAGRLFVPLTRRAAMAGPQGVLLAQRAAEQANRRSKFRFGRDYVLTKRVKGIKPRHIGRNLNIQGQGLMLAAQKLYLRNVIANAR